MTYAVSQQIVQSTDQGKITDKELAETLLALITEAYTTGYLQNRSHPHCIVVTSTRICTANPSGNDNGRQQHANETPVVTTEGNRCMHTTIYNDCRALNCSRIATVWTQGGHWALLEMEIPSRGWGKALVGVWAQSLRKQIYLQMGA